MYEKDSFSPDCVFNCSSQSSMRLFSGLTATLLAVVLGVSKGEDASSPSALGSLNLGHLIQEFEHWLAKHQKRYASLEERALRFEKFVKNKIYIDLHNSQPRKTYELALNEFADLSFDEFHSLKIKGVPRSAISAAIHGEVDTALLKTAPSSLPSSVDWRDSGCVSPVKNQGACGSCYSFSAVGAIESAHCLKHNKELLVLSEEQVISCAHGWYTNGCNGGLMQGVFLWAEETGGLCLQDDVPYLARPESCPKCEKKVQLTGFRNVPRYNELALKAAVAQNGPISIAIEADQTAFQFYKNGVLTGNCGDNLDHGVLLVGYGKDADSGHDYWLVKNSWGENWGEKGYIRIGMASPHISGNCGILGMPSYPIAA